MTSSPILLGRRVTLVPDQVLVSEDDVRGYEPCGFDILDHNSQIDPPIRHGIRVWRCHPYTYSVQLKRNRPSAWGGWFVWEMAVFSWVSTEKVNRLFLLRPVTASRTWSPNLHNWEYSHIFLNWKQALKQWTHEFWNYNGMSVINIFLCEWSSSFSSGALQNGTIFSFICNLCLIC